MLPRPPLAPLILCAVCLRAFASASFCLEHTPSTSAHDSLPCSRQVSAERPLHRDPFSDPRVSNTSCHHCPLYPTLFFSATLTTELFACLFLCLPHQKVSPAKAGAPSTPCVAFSSSRTQPLLGMSLGLSERNPVQTQLALACHSLAGPAC